MRMGVGLCAQHLGRAYMMKDKACDYVAFTKVASFLQAF